MNRVATLTKTFSCSILLAATLTAGGRSTEEVRKRPSCNWACVTATDVETAYQLLVENHPGAVAALGDVEFREHLEQARAQALSAATGSVGASDHNRIMTAFAAALDDPHLYWQPASPPHGSITGSNSRRPAPSIQIDGAKLGIRLPRFDDRARALVIQFAAQAHEFRPLERIEIDLRGNNGGDSTIGDTLISAIYGSGALTRLRAHYPNCPVAWRASAGNVAELARISSRMIAVDAVRAKVIGRERIRLEQALQAGQPFVTPFSPECVKQIKPELPKDRASLRVVVLTDEACFSSCLLTVERLRALGARQTGRPTRSGNWYMEVRAEPLPSGLGSFSVVQKVDLRRSRLIGPFYPDEEPPPQP